MKGNNNALHLQLCEWPEQGWWVCERRNTSTGSLWSSGATSRLWASGAEIILQVWCKGVIHCPSIHAHTLLMHSDSPPHHMNRGASFLLSWINLCRYSQILTLSSSMCPYLSSCFQSYNHFHLLLLFWSHLLSLSCHDWFPCSVQSYPVISLWLRCLWRGSEQLSAAADQLLVSVSDPLKDLDSTH